MPGAVLRLFENGRLESTVTSPVDDGSICPVAIAGRDDAFCLDAEVTGSIFAADLAPAPALRADAEWCTVAPGPPRRAVGPCVRSDVGELLVAAHAAAIAARDRTACAGDRCGIAIEEVELEHPHHATSFHFRAELWADGRWRCESPAPSAGWNEGGCAYSGAAFGRVSPEEASVALDWLAGGSLDALRAASDEAALHAQRNFLRLAVFVPAPSQPDAVFIGGAPATDALERWRRIAEALDRRCMPAP